MIAFLRSFSGPKLIVIAVVVSGLAVAVWRSIATTGDQSYEIVLPRQLSAAAMEGKALFEENCAVCHGIVGGGTDNGPPLVHDIYNPGHHGDVSFLLAARNGVRAHHWRFGDKPPQPQVKGAEVERIVRFVRELQRANGIGHRARLM